MSKLGEMIKPIKPIEPKPNDAKYPKDRKSMREMTPEEVENIPFIKDHKKYRADLEKYNTDIEIYEQIKLIKLIKNSTEKYCLNNLKVTRKIS